MKIAGCESRTIWVGDENPLRIETIDQRLLPFSVKTFAFTRPEDAAYGIREMVVRGAPLIGVTAAWGMVLGAERARTQSERVFCEAVEEASRLLQSARPTAVNLFRAVDELRDILDGVGDREEKLEEARARALGMADDDVEICRSIGRHGLPLIQSIHGAKTDGQPVRILTHCNAGWLACVDWGTATAPIYTAHRAGIPLHVWVDETRPRNQGARLTAFELGEEGVPHSLIVDNSGGHLMQHGMVDLVVVGTDRTTRTGDVANKIGTYLKALAAWDNGVPFYVALPSTSIDWESQDGLSEIPIEERAGEEIAWIEGVDNAGNVTSVRICPEGTRTVNYAFDVTPARLVTGLITERGVCDADAEALRTLFPERGQ